MCSTDFQYGYCAENWFHRKVSGRSVVFWVSMVFWVSVVFLVIEEIVVCEEIEVLASVVFVAMFDR